MMQLADKFARRNSNICKEVIQVFRKISKRAQTTAEYAILIAIVVGAIVAMQVYVRRGLQSRVRTIVDDRTLGNQLGTADERTAVTNIFDGAQYDPYYASSDSQSSSARAQHDIAGQDAETSRGTQERAVQNRQQVNSWGSDAAVQADLGAGYGDVATVAQDDVAVPATMQDVTHVTRQAQ